MHGQTCGLDVGECLRGATGAGGSLPRQLRRQHAGAVAAALRHNRQKLCEREAQKRSHLAPTTLSTFSQNFQKQDALSLNI